MKARPAAGVPQAELKILPPILDEHLLSDGFLAELDVAFDSIKMSSKKPTAKSKVTKKKKTAKTPTVKAVAVTREPKKIELEGVQKTFIQLTQNHLKPITRYLKALESGVNSRELCKVIGYIAMPLVQKTKKVYLNEHAESLNQFCKVLKVVSSETSKKLTAEESLKLQIAYKDVEKKFDLSMRGHSTAVLNVVAFYQAIKKNKKIQESNVEKLFAIGIPSISMLRKTSIDELSSLSGIPQKEVTELRTVARQFNVLDLI